MTTAAAGGSAPGASSHWHLRLYIVGQAPRSLAAQMNLRALCRQFLPESHQIEIIDLLEQPDAARAAKVIAVPMTVRLAPLPMVRVIGDLSDREHAIKSLGLAALP